MSITSGGTFMKERPDTVSPKSSESDPPAANQPTGGAGLSSSHHGTPDADTQGSLPAAEQLMVPENPQVVPGQPDGEVDTRA